MKSKTQKSFKKQQDFYGVTMIQPYQDDHHKLFNLLLQKNIFHKSVDASYQLRRNGAFMM